MTVSVIDATEAGYGSFSSNSGTPTTRLFAGSEPPELAAAFRFPLPTFESLTSATLELFNVVLTGSVFSCLLGARSSSAFPTTNLDLSWLSLDIQHRIATASASGAAGAAGNTVITGATAYISIDVANIISSGIINGYVDSHICFTMINQSSSGSYIEFDGINPSSFGTVPPRLTLNYEESGPLWCPGAVLNSSGNNGSFQLYGAS